MAAKFTDSTRNALLTDVISRIGSTGVLVIYSGAPTGKTGGAFNADPSGQLVEIPLPASPFGAPAAGVASIAGGPWTGTATAGTSTAPLSYRIKTAAGGAPATVVVEGPAGVGTGDLSVAVAITTGLVVSVSSFTLTAGNA